MEEKREVKSSYVSEESSQVNMDGYIASSGDFYSLSDSSGEAISSVNKEKKKGKERERRRSKENIIFNFIT
eukprot:8303620-Ditylum_brightwellii.AAC.1